MFHNWALNLCNSLNSKKTCQKVLNEVTEFQVKINIKSIFRICEIENQKSEESKESKGLAVWAALPPTQGWRKENWMERPKYSDKIFRVLTFITSKTA